MLFHDPVADGEAQAGPLTHGLGGKEGIEHLAEEVRGDARARVADLEPDPARAARFVKAGRDGDVPALGREIDGVQQQVHQELPEAACVGGDLRQIAVQRERQGMLQPAGPVLKQEQHFLDKLVDVDLAERAARRPRELQQAFEDPLAPEDLAVDGPQILGKVLEARDVGERRFVGAVEQRLGIARDDPQGIVDLVRDARHKRAERRQFVRADKLLFEPPLCCHVLEIMNNGVEPALVVQERIGPEVENVPRVVLELLEGRALLGHGLVAQALGDGNADPVQQLSAVRADDLGLGKSRCGEQGLVGAQDLLFAVLDPDHVGDRIEGPLPLLFFLRDLLEEQRVLQGDGDMLCHHQQDIEVLPGILPGLGAVEVEHAEHPVVVQGNADSRADAFLQQLPVQGEPRFFQVFADPGFVVPNDPACAGALDRRLDALFHGRLHLRVQSENEQRVVRFIIKEEAGPAVGNEFAQFRHNHAEDGADAEES